MTPRDTSANGRARPVGDGLAMSAPRRPRCKKLPHERPLWLRPEDEIFFMTVCCEPRGKNQLCYRKIARAIFDSVEFRNQNYVWYARLVCLMPDHLHALLSFPHEFPIKQIMSDWKGFLATDPQKNATSERPALRGGAPGGRALPMLIALAGFLFASCRPDMMNQPKAKPLSESDFFTNGTNARQPPAHTVTRGDARADAAFYTGQTNGTYVTQLPIKLTRELMIRGRERFDAICAECHDRTGSGNGMVVQRGFPQPPSFHVDRLRNAPIGHFVDVMTNGYGVMYSYATRVNPEDRWAIAAYIRALQLSHNAKPSDVDPGERAKLKERK